MREIILDTETTGLSPQKGDRLVELACVELVNHVPTGKFYHTYINPEREVPAEARAVHGLEYSFLKNHPTFSQVATLFLEFIQGDALVIHNAEFDLKFLNAELGGMNQGNLQNPVIDTLAIARRKFPGSPASLDALCRRFKIDNRNREKHGALIDCHLLSSVYLELKGGRQSDFGLFKGGMVASVDDLLSLYKDKPLRMPRSPFAENS